MSGVYIGGIYTLSVPDISYGVPGYPRILRTLPHGKDKDVNQREESLEELEAKNGKSFHFTVSNAPTAARLLESRLGVQDVQVDSSNGLTVRSPRLDAGEAVRLFVDAGLSVSDAHLYEDTLEDYFKQVTGGEGIA